MKKLLLLIFIIIPSLVYSADFGDFAPNKAKQIKVRDLMGYYGFPYASPPTVESALEELGASKAVVATNYVKLNQSIPQTMTGLVDGFLKLVGGVISTGTVDLSAYVPYTGATSNVNLGSKSIITTGTASPSVVDTEHIENTSNGKVEVRDPDGLGVSKISSLLDSTTALGIFRADGLHRIANFDTTNDTLSLRAVKTDSQFSLSQDSFDKIFIFDGSSYTDRTVLCSEETGGVFPLLTDTNDYAYIGDDNTFKEIFFGYFYTGGIGYTLKAEYWDGDSWETLVITDGTNNLQNSWNSITFAIPGNWDKTTVNSASEYWVRLSTTTAPALGQIETILKNSDYRFAVWTAPGNDTPTFSLDKQGYMRFRCFNGGRFFLTRDADGNAIMTLLESGNYPYFYFQDAGNVAAYFYLDASLFHLDLNNARQFSVTNGLTGFGTSDFDGTPAVGQVIIKGTTSDGTTNILVGRDSGENNVFRVDTDGVITITNGNSTQWNEAYNNFFNKTSPYQDNWNTSYNNFANKSVYINTTSPIYGGGQLTGNKELVFNSSDLNLKNQTKSVSIYNITTSHDPLLWKTPKNINITAISMALVGGTDVVGALEECDSGCANCVVVNATRQVLAAGTTNITTISNPLIDTDDWLKWNTSVVNGTPSNLAVTVKYDE